MKQITPALLIEAVDNFFLRGENQNDLLSRMPLRLAESAFQERQLYNTKNALIAVS